MRRLYSSTTRFRCSSFSPSQAFSNAARRSVPTATQSEAIASSSLKRCDALEFRLELAGETSNRQVAPCQSASIRREELAEPGVGHIAFFPSGLVRFLTIDITNRICLRRVSRPRPPPSCYIGRVAPQPMMPLLLSSSMHLATDWSTESSAVFSTSSGAFGAS